MDEHSLHFFYEGNPSLNDTSTQNTIIEGLTQSTVYNRIVSVVKNQTQLDPLRLKQLADQVAQYDKNLPENINIGDVKKLVCSLKTTRDKIIMFDQEKLKECLLIKKYSLQAGFILNETFINLMAQSNKDIIFFVKESEKLYIQCI